jgi:hypothetical protein
MLKKMMTLAVTAAISLTAGNALAAFADLQLIRIVYERTTGTEELASTLGDVGTLAASGGTIDGTLPAVTTPANLFAAYWALNRTTNELWVSGSTNTTLPPAAVGTLGFNTTKSATDSMYSYYNSPLVAADANGVFTGSQSYGNSYKIKLSANQGALTNGINIATRVNTEASLEGLITGTAPAKLQNLYYFANANTANSKGVKVAVIANKADGSTTIFSNSTVSADTTPPTVDSLTLPATSDDRGFVAVSTFTASDTTTVVAGYLITETDVKPTATAAGWSEAPPTSYTFSTPVLYGVLTPVTLFAWAKDLNGNVSLTSRSATVDVTAIDKAAPQVTALVVPPAASNPTISGIIFTATDDVAVTGYLLNDTGTPPAANDPAWSATAPTSFTFVTNVPIVGDPPKVMFIHAWAKDAAGNIGTMTNVVTLTISAGDKTAPTVTIPPTPVTSISATVNITFTADDNVGVDGYLLNESAITPTDLVSGWTAVNPLSMPYSGNASYLFKAIDPGASSAKTLYVWAKDAAGNVSSANIPVTIVKPAHISGTGIYPDPYYLLLHNALTDVADGDTIQTMASDALIENALTFNRPNVTTTLKGGYNSVFAEPPTGLTTIQGSLTIQNGKLIANGVAIKPAP